MNIKHKRLAAAWVLLVAAWRVLDLTPDGSSGGSQALLRSVAAVGSREERLGTARAPAVLWLIWSPIRHLRRLPTVGTTA